MKRGFTLIELVMVIVILGILAATALPRFVDLGAQAREAAARGSLGNIRAAIAIRYASNAATGQTNLIPVSIEASMFQDNLIPTEPYCDCDDVEVGTGEPAPTASVGGWYYDSANGRVYINHSDYSMY